MGSIQSTKAAIGYKTAGQRPTCGNCKHVAEVFADRAPPYDKLGWECSRYGFATTVQAICDQHQPKVPKKGGAA